MISNNNDIRNLSKDLLAAVRGVMEGKTNKHGHDVVGKETADIDNDGDTDKSDKYLHNRRNKIAASMKKEEVAVDTVIEEDAEQLDELSNKTMISYRTKAEAQIAEKKKGKVSAARKAMKEKRMAGSGMAAKKIQKRSDDEFQEHKDVTDAVTAHVKSVAPKILGKHGFKKVIDNEKKSIFMKADNNAGVVHTVKLHKTDGNHKHHVSSYSTTTGWQSTDDRHDADDWMHSGFKRMADVENHKKAGELRYDNHIKKQVDYHTERGLKESKDEVIANELNESTMSAPERYNHYHDSINGLLKSITGHMKTSKTAAMATKMGNHKGIHWGHVGDLAHVHGELADLHDRLARSGEYKIAQNEAVRKEVETVSEDVELTAEEQAAIDAIFAGMEDGTLDEARGRPRKKPLPASEQEEPEPRQHIMQQLQRAKLSMQGSAKVKFKDGTTHDINGRHAASLLDKYAGMKPHEKEDFQKIIGQSHEGLKSKL